MTPQQLFAYKKSWQGNSFDVRIHSDLRGRAKDWCKTMLDRREWDCNQYTDVYEDTFIFEKSLSANAFAKAFEEWVQL